MAEAVWVVVHWCGRALLGVVEWMESAVVVTVSLVVVVVVVSVVSYLSCSCCYLLFVFLVAAGTVST